MIPLPKLNPHRNLFDSISPVSLVNLIFYLFLALLATACTSQSKAKAQAHAAFLAGQQQAMARMMQPRGPAVSILGDVRIPSLPWTEDLTVAKAIVAAGYLGSGDPSLIVLIRNGEAITIDPGQLLNGQDLPMQPGDVLQIQR
jgi:protein involved in polysaccharide export with SLBB domain